MALHRGFTAALLLAALVSGRALAAAAPKPSPTVREAAPGCVWKEAKGRTASIWSYRCPGEWLEADDALPGFVLKSRGEAKPKVAIRFFTKAAGEPVTAVTAAVRAASPGPHSAQCALKPVPANPGMKGRLFDLEPMGATAKAWAASQKTSAMPDEPCGPLGVAYVGDRLFRQMADDPTQVVFLDMGSEAQIFDPATLRRTRR